MLRTVLIVASAVVLLAVGAMTAAAGNAHGKAAATLANSTVLKGNANSTLAKATEAAPTQPKAQTQSSQAETDTDTADEDTDEDADEAGEDANEANVEAAAAAPAAAPAMKAEQEGAEHDD
jgi:hypothetical protein